MVKKNYKSDFELIYTLLDSEGNEMQVPDNPWELWLSCGNPLGANGRKFIASYDGSAYRNCEVRDNNIIVYADNHHLPTGVLWTTFVDYQPNLSFADGDKTIYTPQPTNVELVSGAGDEPTETDIEILANYVVYEHNYTAGQGITIENDVISATGESYTAGEGITIADGEIGLSQGTLDELESHDADIRDLITSVNSLERGNERAVRLTDTTTTGEVGKVPIVDEEVVGSTYSRITADVFNGKMVESDGGVCYAFPSSSQQVQEEADDMLLASGDYAVLEQQINTKASASDVTALSGRVTAVEGSITDLTTGNNPALRASDKTTEKQIGKVAEYDDSRDTYLDPTTHQPIPQAKVPLLNTGDLYLDGVFRAGMDNKYALPHEGDEVKLRADYVLADEADVTSLSQTVATKADASDVQSLSQTVSGKADQSDLTALGNRVSTIEGDYVTDTELAPISQDVNTLTTNYNSIVNALNQEITELIAGKAMIASALTDRGYPTQATDSSASMAQKIENMAYDAGWLAQIGYSETYTAGVKDSVTHSKNVKDGVENGTISTCRYDKNLVFLPKIDNYAAVDDNTSHFWADCPSLTFVGDQNFSAFRSCNGMFANDTALLHCDKIVCGNRGLYAIFKGCTQIKSIKEIDMTGCGVLGGTYDKEFVDSDNLVYCKFTNLGSNPTVDNGAFFIVAKNWGSLNETNRQSLVDSLLTYSFDRTSAGYSTLPIILHADTLARLTNEEIAAITAKGYTLTS